MPNWCYNSLSWDCGSEKGEEISRCIAPNKELDFNTIVPMPEELNIESGSNGETGVTILLIRFLDDPSSVSEEERPYYQALCDSRKHLLSKDEWSYQKHCNDNNVIAVGKEYIRNYIKYGYFTWYEWCYANWGVKWNASDSIVCDDYAEFSTPWGPPIGFLISLSKAYPDVTFTNEWYEEGGGCGIQTISGGFLSDCDMPEDRRKEIFGDEEGEECDEIDF